MTRYKLSPELIALYVVGVISAWSLTPFALPHRQHEIVLSIAVSVLVATQMRGTYVRQERKFFRWAVVYAVAMATFLVYTIVLELTGAAA